jgi:hypothetical protein
MDYTYSPEKKVTEIEEEVINPKLSTTIQDLDIYDNFEQNDIENRYQAINPNSADDYQEFIQGGKGTSVLQSTNIPPKKIATVVCPNQFEELKVKNFLQKISSSYIDILNDLLKGKLVLETFTKDFRLISIGILMVFISIFFVFFNKIDA